MGYALLVNAPMDFDDFATPTGCYWDFPVLRLITGGSSKGISIWGWWLGLPISKSHVWSTKAKDFHRSGNEPTIFMGI